MNTQVMSNKIVRIIPYVREYKLHIVSKFASPKIAIIRIFFNGEIIGLYHGWLALYNSIWNRETV